MSTILPGDADDRDLAPLPAIDTDAGRELLLGVFRGSEKPRAQHRVGTEHEKFGFVRASRAPLPYEGERGIEQILLAIAKAQPAIWRPVDDRGRVIALYSEQLGSVTLEPGGQLELSGAPVSTIHETCREVGQHLRLLREVCVPRGVGFIGMGFHPTATWAQMPTVPKQRYAVMERYMPTVGKRGLDMMKRTATVQANFDWSDERDFKEKMQAALRTAPLVAALFANSPLVEGKPWGGVSERQRVWADTDPRRSGFPQAVLDDDFGYQRWLDLVLDVPMYFVRRGGEHRDVAGASFRSFWRDGLGGERASLRDFVDHMTTVFFEVRAKKVIEVRSADGGPWSAICALPALYKGFLYDDEARAQALRLLDDPSAEELAALRKDVAVRGFRAEHRGERILEPCARLVDIAAQGLVRAGKKNRRGEDESRFLRPLVARVEAGETFAERLLRLLRDDWRGDVDKLWDAVEFFHEDETADLVESGEMC